MVSPSRQRLGSPAGAAARALASAEPAPLWMDGPGRPEPAERLVGTVDCDLGIVGAGFTGLWAALLAKEQDPDAEVAVVEAQRVAWAATGRNGGFCEASLTHGLANGLARFPDEIAELERLGAANLSAIAATVVAHGIDCGWEPTGTLEVATEAWQLAGLEEAAEVSTVTGRQARLLDAAETRAELDSPTYLGAVATPDRAAMVDPARLAWGLAAAGRAAGVRFFERTAARRLRRDASGVTVLTPHGALRARKVLLATNVYPSLVRRARPYTIPVWDYVLATEPLSGTQMQRIGWAHRQGVSDSGNQFHYYRLTSDDRIVWGGYDAVYYRRRGLAEERAQRPATFEMLATHFFATFPQLHDVRFTHCWGGAIDTCTRFCPYWGTSHGGDVAWVAGYTGLGVGASRFGALVALDLLAGCRNDRTALQMVRRKPLPFPPNPFCAAAVGLTRRSLARADRDGGRRDLWLRGLDRLGVGFDS